MHTVTIFNAKILTTDLTSSCPCCQLGKLPNFDTQASPIVQGSRSQNDLHLSDSFHTFGKILVHVRVLKLIICSGHLILK